MKILIISYYAFPLNAVPSYRIESFCEGFTKEGGDVTLLTRHWDEGFNSWDDILTSNLREVEIKNEKGFREIRLPFSGKPKPNKYRLLNTINTIKDYVFGNLQPEIDSYKTFKDYALNMMLEERNFDLIFVSAPPNNLVKLASYLHTKTKVPFVVDFRDYLNNQYLTSNPSLSLRDKTLNFLSSYYVNLWLKKCALVTTVSPKLKSIFEEKFNKKTHLILNGYEQKYFSEDLVQIKPNEVFTIRYIGSIYNGFNFGYIVAGLLKFKKEFSDRRFKIELIGSHNLEIEALFEKNFSSDELEIIKMRVSKAEVVEKSINADVLLLVWNIYKDNYGTKLFDYLASGSHILLSPSDNSVVEEIVNKCENGSVANSSDEVFNVLTEQYEKWLKGENKFKINNYPKFARENIVKDLYNTLKKTIT